MPIFKIAKCSLVKKLPYLSILYLLVICTNPALADEQLKNDNNSKEKDGANPYAYLNWIPRSEFKRFQHSSLDATPRYCGGAYLSPKELYSDDQTSASNRVTAFADKAQHWPGISSTFSGNVAVQQGNLKFEADEIFFDYVSGLAQAPGKLKINVDGMLFLGENASIDMNKQSLKLEDVEYAIYNAHVWGSAKKISKTKSITHLRGTTYTTCEPGDRPSWRLRTGKLRLNNKTGWGTARNVWLDLFNFPALYIPYFRFPIDDQRHTGVLFPSLATGEDGGLDFTLPFYFNLAPNYDLTVSPRRIPTRGVLWQTKFRYLSNSQKGNFKVTNLNNDKKIIDSQNDPLLVDIDIKPDRNFASWQHQGSHGAHLNSIINMEYASDEDYFQDFGNTLDISNTTHLLRSLELNYLQKNWALNGKFQGFQTLDNDIADEDLPYLQIPKINFTSSIPLKYQTNYLLNTEYVYFDRNINSALSNNTVGHRAQIETGLELNYEPIWGYIKPAIKARHISYSIEEQSSDTKSSPETTLPSIILDSGLFFERSFKQKGKRYLQTFDPRLFYLYTPFKDQSSQPNFDTTAMTDSYYQLFRERRFTGGDRIGDNNQLSVGINSSILGATDGRERAYFRLGQGFFLDNRKTQLDYLAPDDTEQTPISGEAGFTLDRDWLIHSTFTWDADNNINEENTIALTYKPGNGRLASVEYRSRETVINGDFDNREQRSQSKFSFTLPLHNQWSTLGYWYYNLKDQDNLPGSTTLESFIGVEYENCCIKARLLNHRYLREQENQLIPRQQLLLQLQLKGLANLDDHVAKLIEIGIPFYEQRYQPN